MEILQNCVAFSKYMNFKYFRGQLPLEGMDEIHNCESLPLGVFGVNDSIMDDILKEDLEDTAGLLE